nr:immunoglobulin heavy chain junction region [Mus musculus]
CARVGNSLDYW